MPTSQTPPVILPSAEHPITITPSNTHVVVKVAGRIIADTRAAMKLQEANYPAVLYIPRADADMTLLERSSTSSHCPYKGDASYYSIPVGGARSKDAIWSYEAPHEAVAQIEGHLAFYPDRVDSIEETS
jgi:uncharacterized protein (DUF427 family)